MNRRKTLGTITTSQGNARNAKPSNLPQPGFMKPGDKEEAPAKINRRASALPAMGRASVGGPRPSIGMRRQSTMGGGRLSMANSRQSMSTRLSMSRQSSVGYTNGKIHDPRPIGDKKNTQANIKTLITYLTTHYYDRPVNPKLLSAPTGKDFRAILTFLFQQIDPNFEFGDSYEEEVKTYFKLFGYPATISKAALTAVGSPHTWPYLLAALVWLVEFLTYDNEVARIKEEGGAIEGDEGEQVFFNYIERAYQGFLEGQDDFKSMDNELQQTFEDKDRAVSEEIKLLQSRNQRFKQEVSRLQNTEAEIEALTTKEVNMQADLGKFKDLIAKLKAHKAGLEEKLEEKNQELGQKQAEVVSLKTEKVELEDLLEKQEFTPLEVQEMGHKKAMLEDSLLRVESKKGEIQQEIWEAEKQQSRRLNQVEKAIKAYNQTAMAVQLIPATAKFAKGVDFELSLDRHKHTARDMVNLDLTKLVKPALLGLKKQLSTSLAGRQRELREAQEHLNATEELVAEHTQRTEAQQKKLDKLTQASNAEKRELDRELETCVAKVEEVEREINRMKSLHCQQLRQSENDVHAVTNALLTTKNCQQTERDQLVAEIHLTSEQVLKHKMHVTGILKELSEGIEESKLALVEAQQATVEKIAPSNSAATKMMHGLRPKTPNRPKTPVSLRKLR